MTRSLADGLRLGTGLQIVAKDSAYLARFRVETCRGELAHWLVFASALFFLWNTPAVGLVMIGYATVANLPCILVQRVNRCRLNRVLDGAARPTSPRDNASRS